MWHDNFSVLFSVLTWHIYSFTHLFSALRVPWVDRRRSKWHVCETWQKKTQELNLCLMHNRKHKHTHAHILGKFNWKIFLNCIKFFLLAKKLFLWVYFGQKIFFSRFVYYHHHHHHGSDGCKLINENNNIISAKKKDEE